MRVYDQAPLQALAGSDFPNLSRNQWRTGIVAPHSPTDGQHLTHTAMSSTQPIGFADLKLPSPLLQALSDVGYEKPSAIQAATIPPMLTGVDVLGQAQTGTGKTAAFALPILARLDGPFRNTRRT